MGSAEPESDSSSTGKSPGAQPAWNLEESMPEISRERLLRMARAAIVAYLDTGDVFVRQTTDPLIAHPSGAFVTLWILPDAASQIADPFVKEKLRGCVGHIHATLPLYRTVQEMAIKAATCDPRFPPLTAYELPQVRIEISVISSLEKVDDLHQIEIGTHGLLIEAWGYRGVLLPKVAVTRKWSPEEFLRNLYFKAGLPSDCWPGHGTLYRFAAIEFGEARSGV